MKIISLVASPHKGRGNTAKLMRIVVESAESEGVQVETIFLPGGTILPCRGCDACHVKGCCPQKDEFDSILNRILNADGLLLGSPNYVSSVSAQMKVFMDRCSSIIHCLGFEGKYGASVVTSGGGDEEPIAEYMNHFLLITGIRPVGSVWATMGSISGESFPEDIWRKAHDLGKRLVRAWREKTTDPVVEEKMAKFRERMKSLIAYRGEEWQYEYDYWKKHRGME